MCNEKFIHDKSWKLAISAAEREIVQCCSTLLPFGKLTFSKSFQPKFVERNVTLCSIDARFLLVQCNTHIHVVQPHFIDTNYAMLNYFL